MMMGGIGVQRGPIYDHKKKKIGKEIQYDLVKIQYDLVKIQYDLVKIQYDLVNFLFW